MEQKSTTYMTLGTAFGMLLAFIGTVLILTMKSEYSTFIPFLFIILGVAFRLIGYGIDRFVDKHNE